MFSATVRRGGGPSGSPIPSHHFIPGRERSYNNLSYHGTILTAIINFLLIALAVYFCIVLPMNKFKERMKKAKDDKPAEPTEAELLVQIRDLLATGRPNASAGQPRPKA